MKFLRLLFILAFLTPPAISLARVQSASIITRPGVATAPIKYYFNLSSALSEGVNQSVKVMVSASNAEKTAIRFESVQLFGKDGAVVGNNVASKTDALTATPYIFSFQNFGIIPADLLNVAGIEIRFMDLGGENPTGKITVQSVAISVTRDAGEACVVVDPITIITPEKPIATITQIQAVRPLVRPGTLGAGNSGSSGGATSQGPNRPNTLLLLDGTGEAWTDVLAAGYSDDVYTNASGPGTTGTTRALSANTFNFSVPTTATINGIVFQVEMKSSNPNSVHDGTVRIIKDGYIDGTDYTRGSSVQWPTSDTVITYGGSSDLWGAVTEWTGSSLNRNDFGLYISAVPHTETIARIDYISATVYYTPLGTSVYDSLMDFIRSLFKKI